MTAAQIIHVLRRNRYDRSTVVPNFTPQGWFECDLFELTGAGLFVEYEVKIDRSDFKADATKTRRIWGDRQWMQLNKHSYLTHALQPCPSRFYFVVPEAMVRPCEIPEFAGLIYMSHDTSQKRMFEMLAVRAPQLHRKKPDTTLKQQAINACYWRLHRVLNQRTKA